MEGTLRDNPEGHECVENDSEWQHLMKQKQEDYIKQEPEGGLVKMQWYVIHQFL